MRQQAASETARRRGGQTTKTRRPCQKAEAECGSLERMCDAFLKGESQRPHVSRLTLTFQVRVNPGKAKRNPLNLFFFPPACENSDSGLVKPVRSKVR